MKQIVDLQSSPDLKSTSAVLLSIATDLVSNWKKESDFPSIDLPLLSDESGTISRRYGVMRWAMGKEPGHTFLVGRDGKVAWIRDCGGMEHGGLMMYADPQGSALSHGPGA